MNIAPRLNVNFWPLLIAHFPPFSNLILPSLLATLRCLSCLGHATFIPQPQSPSSRCLRGPLLPLPLQVSASVPTLDRSLQGGLFKIDAVSPKWFASYWTSTSFLYTGSFPSHQNVPWTGTKALSLATGVSIPSFQCIMESWFPVALSPLCHSNTGNHTPVYSQTPGN